MQFTFSSVFCIVQFGFNVLNSQHEKERSEVYLHSLHGIFAIKGDS